MALIVEDGTGLSGAESYLSVADADAYHLRRGNVAWGAAAPEDKEAALLKATSYLDATYGFAGIPVSFTQARAWPRRTLTSFGRAVIAVGLPRQVVEATAELALRTLSGELAPDNVSASSTELQGSGALIEKRIGPITYKWAAGGSSTTTRTSGPRYPFVDALLKPLLAEGWGSNSARLRRV